MIKSICIYKSIKFAHHILAFDQDNDDLHSQIKSNHQTIGMRIFTVYFSLEGRQAYTKKSGSKQMKGIIIKFGCNACCHSLKERAL